ncbi:LamG domain-containing protein [Vibrio breoganii]|uniref:LamG domain-containing protein n=1 Tax=Vibrio breoganii TaxID=553239 RepID=A0AAN0XXB2_9VIBR|nr:LamG domain-containing protein [Vibrio breoganii]ANO34527.1 hypothetical protein A6E01_15100 [Vibrio breoganii]PMG75266.1 hypothetical protein BCU83_17770 [Vibrio breoganii]PMK44431.1 hypothetical protein BCU00_09700 [Vibrio breoganii]
MEISKSAIAVAISATFLFGCDFDVGPDSGGDSGTTPTTPTSDLVGPYWNFEAASSASTQSTDLPNIYVFDGENQKYYTDNTSDTVLGTYVILTETYSEEDGVVTFTYYDAEGNPTKATGQFEVVDGNITIDTDTVGVLNGTDDQTEEVKAAVAAANAEAGFNNLVQILDTKSDDTGELRLKLADSSTDVPVDQIASGKITVDLIYQKHEDTEQVEDEDGNNAYITLYASGTGNAQLYGEAVFNNGEIFYRSNTIEGGKPQLSDAIGTYTLGEDLAVEVEWGNDEYSFSVNDTTYGPFPYAADNTPVQVIALKMGDNSNTTHFELLADNFKVYNIEGANEELVFEDNFDGYAIGQDLSGNPYNNNSSEAVVVSATGEEPEPTPEPDPEPTPDPDFPVADFAWDFSAVDGGAVIGSKSLTISKDSDNPKVITDGAVEVDGAVHTTQSLTSGTYGYYYTAMEGTSDPLAFTDGTFSMEIVFSIDDVTFNPGFSQDLQLLENTDSNKGYKLIIDKSSLKPKLRIYDGSGSSSVEAETTVANGEFMHVVATFDNGTAKVYVNGVEEGTGGDLTFVPNTKDGDKVYVGGGSNSSQKNLEGALDNAAFFNDVLTAEEVALRAAEFGFTTN